MERKLLDKARPISVQETGCTGGAGVRTGQGRAQGFRRFMRRGLGAAQSEWSLAGTTHNLLKLWRSGQAPLAQAQGAMELRE